MKVGVHQGSVLSSLLCQLIDFTNSVQTMRDCRTVLKKIMLIIALLAYTFVLTKLELRCILLFTFCLLSSVVVTRPRATTVNNTHTVEVYIYKIIYRKTYKLNTKHYWNKQICMYDLLKKECQA